MTAPSLQISDMLRIVDLDDLVLAVLGGDSRAWDKLAGRLAADLRPFLRRSLDEQDASDIIQITLIIVMHKLPEFEVRSGQPFRSWVRGIARIEVLELLRERGRRDRGEARAARIGALDRTSSPHFSSRLDRAREAALVEQAIPRLRSPYRVVIENDLAEGDPRALAERERIAPSTVRTRRERAHGILRRLVRKPVVNAKNN